MRRLALLSLFLLAPALSVVEGQNVDKPAGKEYGVLLLAHGGDPRWNKEIASLRDSVNGKLPTEASLGMAYGGAQVREIQQSVDRLQGRGIKKIIAVPLFVSSDSEVMDQIRYVLGISNEPSKTLAERMQAYGSEHGHMGHGGHDMGHDMGKEPKSQFKSTFADFSADSAKQVKSKVPLVLSPALDDHPLVAKILLARAKKLSREPSKETVILVGHGPVEDDKNETWLEMMGRLGEDVRVKGGFRAVDAATMRDDAPSEVREKAVKELRAKVQKAARDGGRVIVIPHLIARGGIESKVTRALEGLTYAWNGDTLMPDPSMAKWVRETAQAAAGQDDMRKSK